MDMYTFWVSRLLGQEEDFRQEISISALVPISLVLKHREGIDKKHNLIVQSKDAIIESTKRLLDQQKEDAEALRKSLLVPQKILKV